MRVLVTGGAGYIGSGVAEAVIESGHEAVVYDNLGKGHRDAVHPAARFFHNDLFDGAALREALQGVDSVIHLAAESLVGESVIEPAKYYRANLGGGLALLDALRECGVKQLVFSSTAAVYGEPARLPIDEDDPARPTNPYGESKHAFERALGWYGKAYGLRSICLRYFNAAGATARCRERHAVETHLIPLILQVAAGLRPHIVVHGEDYPTPDGTCIRDYVHVADLASAHVLALDALARGHKGGAYHLGCGMPGSSVRQVIELAREVSGRKVPVVTGPRRPGDPAVLVASPARIERELGWKARHDLRAIVQTAWDALDR